MSHLTALPFHISLYCIGKSISSQIICQMNIIHIFCSYPLDTITKNIFHLLYLSSVGIPIKTDNEYDCAKKCRELDGCEGFLYLQEGFKNPSYVNKCFLRKDLKDVVPVRTNDNMLAGYRSCTNEYTTIDSK